jgi:hypothetical protein
MAALTRAASAAALLVMVSLSARAQDPVTLPGVSVLARVEKPGPRMVTGIVVDTAGNVIPGAEVTIPGLAMRMFTKADGTFRFVNVRPGKHSMRARKLGFAPQVREFKIDSTGGIAPFQLLPIVTPLPAMVTSASKRGLSGYVGDVNMESVPGANVRLLGSALNATTDAEGSFFIPAEPGRYMVAISKDSFTTKLVSVSVPADSGRHINAWLMPGGKVEKEHFWNVEDLRERLAWVKPADRVLFTSEDLARLKIEWVYDAVATTGPRYKFNEPFSRDCMVVVNGGPEIASLADLTIDDVESVEVYAKLKGDSSSAVAAAAPQSKVPKPAILANAPKVEGGKFVWIDNSRRAAMENSTRICPGVYVWLR